MHANHSTRVFEPTAAAFLIALACTVYAVPCLADEDPFASDPAGIARYRTHELYTTHAPGLQVPGRFQAGPCIGAARHAAETGAQYEPGVDAHGNVVVPAELPSHSDAHWAGPSLQYLARRRPTAIERRYALAPRDYVTVDSQRGTIHYNDYPLRTAGEIPPPPIPCE